ncbi:restriction endonuclease [Nocardia salmonicida]|uniref:restriction endonuclease n=1 Tax=Nocardia salmonicida TaxID=53431 RepID=UPI0037BD057E
MPKWRDFQEASASFYRDLGLDAATDVTLNGVRGIHDIDVTVRGNRAGVDFLWIVECKLWSRRVPKSAVAILSSIVQDVGADRGIILSSSGFQAGTPLMARMSNITLTSLEQLRMASDSERVEHAYAILTKRCQYIIDAVNLGDVYDGNPDGRLVAFKHPHLAFAGRAGVIKTAIDQARAGDWPVTIITIIDDAERYARAEDVADLLELADYAVTRLESDFGSVMDECGGEPGADGVRPN